MVGMIVFTKKAYPISLRRSFLGWIENSQSWSATRFGDGRLSILGKLFLMDLMNYVTMKEITRLRNYGLEHMSMDRDSLPKVDPPDYPIDALSDQIIALLQSLNLSGEIIPSPASTDSLDSIAEDLVERLDFMKQRVKEWKNIHHNLFNGYIAGSNMMESHAVKRFAILASIFLPLSLGADILSMQSRLADIHLILWDFVAVCVDMGLLALIFFQVTASRTTGWMKSVYSQVMFVLSIHYLRVRSRGSKRQRQLELVCGILGLPGLIAVVVALNLGVFGDIQLAWRILVYGLAGGLGPYVLLIIAYGVADRHLSWFRIQRRMK